MTKKNNKETTNMIMKKGTVRFKWNCPTHFRG